MKKFLLFIALILFCCAFTGCASQYKVNVNGITAGPDVVAGSNCVIVPGNENIAGDLAFREFSVYVADALSRNGYRVTNSENIAQTGILMSYWVGDPLETFQSSPAVSIGAGFYDGWGRHHHGGWGWGFAPSFYIPLNDISSYTTYGCYLSLAAYNIPEYRSTGKVNYLWQLNVAIRSDSSDLRALMPVLVAAAEPYIGHNTGNQLVVTIDKDDPYLLQLQGMGPMVTTIQRTDYTSPK